MRLKNIFAAAREQDRVGEFVEPDRPAARPGLGRDQVGLGVFGFEIMDDGEESASR